jgi:5'-nucleotidase
MEELHKINRRNFFKQSALIMAGTSIATKAIQAKDKTLRLTVLHTNDWHSRIEPFNLNDKDFGGKGGAEARAALIKKIREEEENVLLLDAGDIFQGTPYFNFYGGELEYKLMSQMGYDCVTLGNHDFDNGINGLLNQMPHANFDFVNCNYDFSETELKNKIAPYKIYHKGGIKIGVIGVGIELNGLVPEKLVGSIKYTHPIEKLNSIAQYLKEKKGCNLVICLSHLGYQYSNNKISDLSMAPLTKNIDLIIGGHTHTFLKEPNILKNAEGKNVIINQVGWAGLNLGKINFIFNQGSNTKNTFSYQNVNIVKTIA